MIDLAHWIERLSMRVPTLAGRVAGAADLAAAAEDAVAPPAAWVLREDEQAAPNERLQGPVRQRLRCRVSVVLAVENVADARGEAADADLLALRRAVFAALIGWTPPGAETPVELAAGGRLGFDDQILWWGDLFTTYTWMEQTP